MGFGKNGTEGERSLPLAGVSAETGVVDMRTPHTLERLKEGRAVRVNADTKATILGEVEGKLEGKLEGEVCGKWLGDGGGRQKW